MDIFVEDLGRSMTFLNIYGPYMDRVHFWEGLLINSFCDWDKVILGGNLNFSLRAREVWGMRAYLDHLTDFFIHVLDQRGLVDIEPTKVNPTWRNQRTREDKISKRLNHFLVVEKLRESMD